jgi:hypothetical protein
MKRICFVRLKLYENGRPTEGKKGFATIASDISSAAKTVLEMWEEYDQTEKGFEWRVCLVKMSDTDILIPASCLTDGVISITEE